MNDTYRQCAKLYKILSKILNIFDEYLVWWCGGICCYCCCCYATTQKNEDKFYNTTTSFIDFILIANKIMISQWNEPQLLILSALCDTHGKCLSWAAAKLLSQRIKITRLKLNLCFILLILMRGIYKNWQIGWTLKLDKIMTNYT